MTTIQSLRLDGSGKSNVMEALELLRLTPSGFAEAIRAGGGPREWLWKGSGTSAPAGRRRAGRRMGEPVSGVAVRPTTPGGLR